jgi:hypothetical protein
MANITNPPSATTGAFALPPTAAELNQSGKGVSWSATPKEIDDETIEKRKLPITYTVAANLSLLTVFKTTLTMLQATDPSFILISDVDSTVTLRNATEVDKLSVAEAKKFFPSVTTANHKVNCKLFFLASKPIHRLKKDTFGFYDWAARKVWIFESHATDVRNVGFLIYRDPRRVDRDSFTKELIYELNEFPLSDDDADRYNTAKDASSFEGGLPKFHLQQSDRISSRNGQGLVSTRAVTVHCQHDHQGFMVPFLSRYFEQRSTSGQFVGHSIRNGQDPTHLKAYHSAIVLQNQYLANVSALPVIGISPKALQQPITLGEAAPERLIDVLNRYKQFSSIEPTPQSDKLGKYIFITTAAQFDTAKAWINSDLPQIWAELDKNFLDELPTSVKCPRLTTSNLKDATTSRTVAMLNDSRIPDEVTVAAKWSKPPQIGRHRSSNTASIATYTHDEFPELEKKPSKRGKSRNQQTDTTDNLTASSKKKTTNRNNDQNSTHSNASTTSAGTSFSKEDGQSLFTTLTESFIEDMKSQTAQQNKTIADLIANQLKRDEEHRTDQAEQRKEEAAARKEQALERKEQAAQISQLLNLFASTSITQQNSQRQYPSHQPEPQRRRRRRTKRTKDTEMSKHSERENMDTSQASASPKRSMDTDSSTASTPKTQPRLPPNELRLTANEWEAKLAAQEQQTSSKPTASAASQAPSSSGSSTISSSEEETSAWNRQGRRKSELTAEENARYAAESAETAAAAGAVAAKTASLSARKAAASVAITIAKIAAVRTEPNQNAAAAYLKQVDPANAVDSDRSRSRSPDRTKLSRRQQRLHEKGLFDKKTQAAAREALVYQRSQDEARAEEEDEQKTQDGEGLTQYDEAEWDDQHDNQVTQELQAATPDATETGRDDQSYGTVDSQDPTHEEYANRPTDPASREMSQLVTADFSPPRIERQGTTAITTPPGHHSPQAIENAHTELSPTSRLSTDPTQTTDWQMVSASKRKAKVSPGKTLHSLSLRKEAEPRALKKLSQARDSASEVAGPQK